MNIVSLYPPNWELIKTILPVEEKHQPIFPYGDIIYNPFNVNITPDREIHEEVHKKQQGKDIEGWWNRYLTDSSFRGLQELEAYSYQYRFAKQYVKDTKILNWLLDKLVESLSGEEYGKLYTFGEAKSKIRNFTKNLCQ